MQPIQRRILYVLILIAGLAWIILTADKTGASTAGRIPAPREGFVAPDFSLKPPTDELFTLSQLHGKAVLVNIWATWCHPVVKKCQLFKSIIGNIKPRDLSFWELIQLLKTTHWRLSLLLISTTSPSPFFSTKPVSWVLNIICIRFLPASLSIAIVQSHLSSSAGRCLTRCFVQTLKIF
jgi:hypothetical protein